MSSYSNPKLIARRPKRTGSGNDKRKLQVGMRNAGLQVEYSCSQALALPVAVADAADVDYAALLRQYRIKLTGLDPPNPVTSLAEIVGTQQCPRVLADNWDRMGFKSPTGIQLASWGVMLNVRQKDKVLACNNKLTYTWPGSVVTSSPAPLLDQGKRCPSFCLCSLSIHRNQPMLRPQLSDLLRLSSSRLVN